MNNAEQKQYTRFQWSFTDSHQSSDFISHLHNVFHRYVHIKCMKVTKYKQQLTNFKISKELNLFYIVFKNKKHAIWADFKKNYHSNLEQILTWSVFDNNKMIWMAKFSQSYLVKILTYILLVISPWND